MSLLNKFLAPAFILATGLFGSDLTTAQIAKLQSAKPQSAKLQSAKPPAHVLATNGTKSVVSVTPLSSRIPVTGLPEVDGHPFCPIPPPLNQAPRPANLGPVVATPPVLNSRPAAVAALYLDFDGEVVTDPAWNGGQTINAAAFNLSLAEINAIVTRVGEDFAAFNINVTTDLARYNAAPVGKRMRCIVTPTTTAYPGAGGVAYLDSFSEAGINPYFSATIPCWVFNTSASAIAEAASHEFGHTLSLNHDGRTSPSEEYFQGHGSGATSWAPIMGVGYYRNVVQWSKGQYQNPTRLEDDLAIISGATNGFGYAPDETGDTPATAAPLGFSSLQSVAQSGTISSSGDADFFAFTTSGGAISLSAAPVAISPNLDIALDLRDETGAILASHNPLAALNASISTTLAAGTYYVTLRGAGVDDGLLSGYTTYASQGNYSLSGSIPRAAPPAQSYTWIGGDGNWNDASKWSPVGFPQAAGDTATFGSGSGTVTLNATFLPDSVTVESGANYVFAGAGGIGGSAALVCNGVLKLANPNSYSGATSIGQGASLSLGDAGASGSIGGGAINIGGALLLNRTDTVTLSNLISGGGTVSQVGSGTTALGGANTHSGGTNITSGTLSISSAANLGAAQLAVNLNGGTLQTTASFANPNPIVVGASGGALSILGGPITLTSSGILQGGGNLSVTGGNLRADAFQSFNGAMRLQNGGSFIYGASGAINGYFEVLGAGDGVSATSGELIVTPGVPLNNFVLGSGGILSFSQGSGGLVAGQIFLNTAGLHVATRDWNGAKTAGRSGTLSGPIGGAGGLTKSAAGTLSLTGSNNYGGLTRVQSGILSAVGSASALPPASGVIVSSGATLQVRDRNSSGGSSSGAPAGLPNAMTLGGTGSGGIGALNFLNSAGFSLSGTLSLSSDTLVKIDPQNQTAGSGALTFSGPISGAGGLTLWSAGTSATGNTPVILSGSNTYLGTNTVFTSSNLNTSAPFSVTLQGTDRLPTSTHLTLGGAPGAMGGAPGAGVAVALDGIGQTLASLSVASGAMGTHTFAGSFAPAAAILRVANVAASTFNGSLIGQLNFEKSGSGTLTLGGNNTYGGTTTVRAGTLKVAASQPGSPIALSNAGFEKPTVSANSNPPILLAPRDAGWTFSQTGVDGGTGSSGVSGYATSLPPEGFQSGYLQGTSTISQTFTLAQATTCTLAFSALGRSGAGIGPIAFNAQIDGTTVAMVPDTLSTSVWTPFSGTIALAAGTHTLSFVGLGPSQSTKSSGLDAVTLSTSTTSAAGSLPSGTRVNVAASFGTVPATLDLSGIAQSLTHVSGVAPGRVLLGDLTVGGASGDASFAGQLSGPGSLTKVGTGTHTLSGNNSYTGATRVAGGTLRFDVGNFTENLGALQLQGGNLGVVFSANTSASALKFADSSALAWSGSLAIGGFRTPNTQLFIGMGQTLTSEQLAQISFVSPNNLSGTFPAKQLSSGEVVPAFAPAASGGALISEFRFRGPGGGLDEYVEIANMTGQPLSVGGWSIRTRGALDLQTTSIPEGTVIPSWGHLLFAGSGYSLGNHGAADIAIQANALDNSGVALLNAAGATVDAVGFAASDAALREGAGLPSAPTADAETAFMRDFAVAIPKDSGDSSQDFVFVNTVDAPVAGTVGAVASRLGAPSPEGLTSPVLVNHLMGATLLDPSAAQSAIPNRARVDYVVGSPDLGALLVRRTITNNSGRSLSRIRFGVVNITSLNSPGAGAAQADIRVVSSGDENVLLSDGLTSKMVYGTTLETGATGQPALPLGGGLGSSVNFADVTLSKPLAPGETRAYSFRLKIEKGGSFAVTFNILALPGS